MRPLLFSPCLSEALTFIITAWKELRASKGVGLGKLRLLP